MMNRLIILFFIFLMLITTIFMVTSASKYSSIKVNNLWVALPPPVASSTAAYGKIKNTGNQRDRLIAIRSNAANTVQLHESKMTDNMMAMEHITDFVLEPGGELVLKPMSFHLMFLGLTDQFKEKGEVKVWFDFEKSGTIEVDALVLSTEVATSLYQ